MIKDRTPEPVMPPLMPAPQQSLWRVTPEASVHAIAPIVSLELRGGTDESARGEPLGVNAPTPLIARLGRLLLEYYRGVSDGLAVWWQFGAPCDHDGAKVKSARRRALNDVNRPRRP
jgi:hypothetical protein